MLLCHLVSPCRSSSILFVQGKLPLLVHWCSLRQLSPYWDYGKPFDALLYHSVLKEPGGAGGGHGWRTVLLGFLSA